MEDLVCNENNFNLRKRKYADESCVRLLSKVNLRHSMKDTLSCNLLCAYDAFEPMPYTFYKPLPVVYPHLKGKIKDPALILICLKEEYQTSVDGIKAAYNKAKKKRKPFKRFACYEKFQKLLNNDPDRYFCCNYNWYYAGGNLKTHYIDDNVYIIHATNKSELSVAEVYQQNKEWKVKRKNVLFNESSSIFQIDSTLINKHNIACVRCKYSISVYDISFKNLDNVTGKLQKYFESDIPFVGVSVNKHSLNEFAVVNVERAIKIYDTSTGEIKFEKSFPYQINRFEGNHFGQINYYNQNVLAYINKFELNLLDLRTRDECGTLRRDTILHEANAFTNVSLTEDSYCYISTVQDVLQVDLRNMSIVKRWNHSLNSAPILSDSIHNGDSILCISSSIPEEKFVLGQNELRTFVPKYLPTLTNAWESATLHEPSASASKRFEQRINLSTTGLSILPGKAREFTVFTANSLGDVFNYEVIDQQQIADNWNVNRFQELIQNTNKYAMKEKLNYFDKVVLNDLKINIHKDVVNVEDSFNLKRLAYYCDDLKHNTIEFASKLSDAWYDNGIQTLENIEQLPSDINVSHWLSHLSEAVPDEF